MEPPEIPQVLSPVMVTAETAEVHSPVEEQAVVETNSPEFVETKFRPLGEGAFQRFIPRHKPDKGDEDEFDGVVWSDAPRPPEEQFEGTFIDEKLGMWVGSMSCVMGTRGDKKMAYAFKEEVDISLRYAAAIDAHIYMCKVCEYCGEDWFTFWESSRFYAIDLLIDKFFDQIYVPERIEGYPIWGRPLFKKNGVPMKCGWKGNSCVWYRGGRFTVLGPEEPWRQQMESKDVAQLLGAMSVVGVKRNKGGWWDVFYRLGDSEELSKYTLIEFAKWHTDVFGDLKTCVPEHPKYGGLIRDSVEEKWFEFFN